MTPDTARRRRNIAIWSSGYRFQACALVRRELTGRPAFPPALKTPAGRDTLQPLTPGLTIEFARTIRSADTRQ